MNCSPQRFQVEQYQPTMKFRGAGNKFIAEGVAKAVAPG